MSAHHKPLPRFLRDPVQRLLARAWPHGDIGGRALHVAVPGGLLAVIVCAQALRAGPPRPADGAPPPTAYQIIDFDASPLLYGGTAAPFGKTTCDTFYLYGGPGSLQGRFETAQGRPDRQGWSGVDLTGLPWHWHVDTFNASDMGARPPYWRDAYAAPAPNHAMWAGLRAGMDGFATPGYGNHWSEVLAWRTTVANPAVACTLQVDLQFNHDSEPGYDFFLVQWDFAGTVVDLARFDGSNRDGGGQFTSPATLGTQVVVRPGDFVGQHRDEVILLMSFVSDGAWSDEDGLYDGDGAVQVDNIQIRRGSAVLSQATFEGGETGGWQPVLADIAGDFSNVRVLDCGFDPCRENPSPQMTFVDDGTPPSNDPLHRSTGGTWDQGPYKTSDCGWFYPLVNYTGGLTFGERPLANEVWSPEIDWDLPGTADDCASDGAFLRFSVYQYLPLSNGIFWVWHVRSFPDPATGDWTRFKDRTFVYYGGGVPAYINTQLEVRDLLAPEPQKVQIALGMTDLADLFNFPGSYATQSPAFDNVAFAKYDAAEPRESTREIDLFNDGFPTSGAVSCTPADDTDLAIRLDMARDIRASAQPRNVPGDSIICDFVAQAPGSTTVPGSIRMEFLLVTNPCFAAERAGGFAALRAGAGSGASDIQSIGENLYRGYVGGRQSTAADGSTVADRYFFDLPDGPVTLASYERPEAALFFPGDVLRYYLTASIINPAESTTLPADTSGFSSGVGYNRMFTVYGLPSLRCGADTDPCTQPSVLLWNDAPDRGNVDELAQAFGQNGLVLGRDYDQYRTNGAASLASNGLGSAGAHGASSGQLIGYRSLFYDCAALSRGLISDGSGGGSGSNDKGNDVAALTGWMAQAGNRYAAYWGDNVAFGLAGSGVAFRRDVMGVQLAGDNARPSIGNQTAPEVAPTGTVAGFSTHFIVFGGCPGINVFDNLAPGAATAKMAHGFLPGPYTPSASIYNSRQDTILVAGTPTPFDRVNVTFPYGFLYVQDVFPKAGGRSARAELARELLIQFGQGALINDGGAVGTGPITSGKLVIQQNRPNPFIPNTTIAFTAPARGHVSVRIYNLRGELVATLLDGVVDAGQQSVLWSGSDARGGPVASGVYLCRVQGFGQTQTMKLAMIK